RITLLLAIGVLLALLACSGALPGRGAGEQPVAEPDAAAAPGDQQNAANAKEPTQSAAIMARRSFDMRIGVETLRNPYWYEEQGLNEDVRRFWDKKEWERILRGWKDEHYSAVIYWIEPWNKHGWQTFLVRHERFPEARGLTAEQSERLAEHVNWIFRK